MKTIVDKLSPITGGALELRFERATVVFRGETIRYRRSFYHCVDSGFEFTDDDLEASNLKTIQDIYRKKHSIPLAEDLKRMRERYGIPSSAMSLILGLGENQYALYEDGVVPSLSIGKLLTLANDPRIMKVMLLIARSSFSEKQYAKYYAAIDSSLMPAIYEVDRVHVSMYESIESLPSGCFLTGKRSSNKTKESYNDFSYAPAY